MFELTIRKAGRITPERELLLDCVGNAGELDLLENEYRDCRDPLEKCFRIFNVPVVAHDVFKKLADINGFDFHFQQHCCGLPCFKLADYRRLTPGGLEPGRRLSPSRINQVPPFGDQISSRAGSAGKLFPC